MSYLRSICVPLVLLGWAQPTPADAEESSARKRPEDPLQLYPGAPPLHDVGLGVSRNLPSVGIPAAEVSDLSRDLLPDTARAAALPSPVQESPLLASRSLPDTAPELGGGESIWDSFGPSDALFPDGNLDAPLMLLAANDAPPAPPEAGEPVRAAPGVPYAPDEDDRPTEETQLLKIARKIAPAVLTLTTWDAYGTILASGTGLIVSPKGLVLTDPEIVHPQFGDRIAYITGVTGTGERYRVEGVWTRQLDTGFALLQIDAGEAPYLSLNGQAEVNSPTEVTVLGNDAERGLLLADAVADEDKGLSGFGWLRVEGSDSPASVGSPLFDRRGKVIGIVSMSVPLDQWTSFAVPMAKIRAALAGGRQPSLVPIAALDGTGYREVTDDRRFSEAVKLLTERRPRSAVRQMLPLTKLYPRSPEIWAILGIGWAKLGQFEEAAACRQRAVALDPSLGEHWYQLALSSIGRDGAQDLSQSISVLERSLHEIPTNPFATLLLAESYIKSGRYQEAANTLIDLIKLRAHSAHAHYLLAVAQGRVGNKKAAEYAARECVRLDRKHAEGWLYLGLVLGDRDDHTGAVSAFKSATRAAPSHPKAWLQLAYAQRDLGNGTAARLAMKKHMTVLADGTGNL